ncbi:hypothetical protein AB0C34_16915 [Nocardia sp. NPDC049220]|uniref:hypothetical protein n=1 Tax=Nocardia sp. NPDC049220 TaxID=3155273 RepID=UPI0033D8DA22
MELNNQVAIANALRAGNPDMPVAVAETWARDLSGWLDEQRCALVNLPEAEVDEWGYRSWPVAEEKYSRVRLDDDGRISTVGVSNPTATPGRALSLAAALIAAAQYVMDESATTGD